jgi:hypothetical protein
VADGTSGNKSAKHRSRADCPVSDCISHDFSRHSSLPVGNLAERLVSEFEDRIPNIKTEMTSAQIHMLKEYKYRVVVVYRDAFFALAESVLDTALQQCTIVRVAQLWTCSTANLEIHFCEAKLYTTTGEMDNRRDGTGFPKCKYLGKATLVLLESLKVEVNIVPLDLDWFVLRNERNGNHNRAQWFHWEGGEYCGALAVTPT